MAITVLTPATSTLLTTADRVAAEFPDIAAARVDDLIADASDIIAHHLQRTLAQQDYRETLPGDGTVILQLRHTPVTAVSQVLFQGGALTDYVIEDADRGWLYREVGWNWTVQYAQSITRTPVPGSERPDYQVDYTGGFVLPDDPDNRTLPREIERASLWLIQALAAAPAPALASVRIGDYQASYREEAADQLPARVQALLAPFRRIE